MDRLQNGSNDDIHTNISDRYLKHQDELHHQLAGILSRSSSSSEFSWADGRISEDRHGSNGDKTAGTRGQQRGGNRDQTALLVKQHGQPATHPTTAKLRAVNSEVTNTPGDGLGGNGNNDEEATSFKNLQHGDRTDPGDRDVKRPGWRGRWRSQRTEEEQQQPGAVSVRPSFGADQVSADTLCLGDDVVDFDAAAEAGPNHESLLVARPVAASLVTTAEAVPEPHDYDPSAQSPTGCFRKKIIPLGILVFVAIAVGVLSGTLSDRRNSATVATFRPTLRPSAAPPTTMPTLAPILATPMPGRCARVVISVYATQQTHLCVPHPSPQTRGYNAASTWLVKTPVADLAGILTCRMMEPS